MPELAEVEFFRKRWHLAAVGEHVVRLLLHDKKKLFSGLDPEALRRALVGASFEDSAARAKQMLFRFTRPGRTGVRRQVWLGIHLGMTGELSVQPPIYQAGKHDHLVIVTHPRRTAHGDGRTSSARPRASVGHALVFNDPRMFGRILFHVGAEAPAWWSGIGPSILSPMFTAKAVAAFLERRRRAPIKAVLLMQERFPGIGNWMADEILWR